jgi:hypothetical protein
MVALVRYGIDPIIALSSRLGPRALWERQMTEERASLEREILLLRKSIAASEAALQEQGISAKDRTWVTKQLGLRQLRLGRLAARLDALTPLRDTSGRRNQRRPMARPKLKPRG